MRSFLYSVMLFNQLGRFIPKLIYIAIYLYFSCFCLHSLQVKFDYNAMLYSIQNPFYTFKYGYKYIEWWFANSTNVSVYYTLVLFFALAFPYLFVAIHKRTYYKYIVFSIIQYMTIFIKDFIVRLAMSRSVDDVKEVFAKLSFAKANETLSKVFTKKPYIASNANLAHKREKPAKGSFFRKRKSSNKDSNDELSAMKQELEQQRQEIMHDREIIQKTTMIIEKAKMDAQRKVLEQKKQLQQKMMKKYDEINNHALNDNQDNTDSEANRKEE